MNILAENLLNLGIHDTLARTKGMEERLNIAGVGTVQATAAIVPNGFSTVTATAGQTAIRLPDTMQRGDIVLISNVSATAGVLFGPTGSTINGGPVNASVAMTAGSSRLCVLVDATPGAFRFVAFSTP